jgi:predicted HAD superfamily Cof-like phosphohydrolase
MQERSDHQLRVEEFMRFAKQDVPMVPNLPSKEVRELRARLIIEEALETIAALGCELHANGEPVTAKGLKSGHAVISSSNAPDLVEIVDGCCDIMVVTTGTLSACGIRDVVPLKMVDENNLAKFGPGHSIRADGKLIKPPNHKAPDLGTEIERQTMFV